MGTQRDTPRAGLAKSIPWLRARSPSQGAGHQQQQRVHELSSETQTQILYQENSQFRFSRGVGGGRWDGCINSNKFH